MRTDGNAFYNGGKRSRRRVDVESRRVKGPRNRGTEEQRKKREAKGTKGREAAEGGSFGASPFSISSATAGQV